MAPTYTTAHEFLYYYLNFLHSSSGYPEGQYQHSLIPVLLRHLTVCDHHGSLNSFQQAKYLES